VRAKFNEEQDVTRLRYNVLGTAVAICCTVSAVVLYKMHQREVLVSRGKEAAERIFVALESYRSEHVFTKFPR